jgi:cytochrome c556
MVRLMLAAAAVVLGATAVLAQTNVIETRQNLMKRNNDNAKIVSAMAKGEAPFDAAKVAAAYADWEDTAKKLPDLFPDNSKTGNKTRAKPEIWTNAADFKAKIADFAKTVADTKAEASTAAGVKTAFPKIIKTCDNCHDANRAPRT